MERSLLEIADLRPVILDTKKVENELTRSRFSASVRVLSVWCACNSSLTVRQRFAADSLSQSNSLRMICNRSSLIRQPCDFERDFDFVLLELVDTLNTQFKYQEGS